MRHEKAETLLRIAIDMQGRQRGLSLADIASDYSDTPLSRRTAERLRDAVIRLFPGQVEELTGESQFKRWRLRTPSTRGLHDIDEHTIASLDTAARQLQQAGLDSQAVSLTALRSTLIALLEQRSRGATEESGDPAEPQELLAIRPGPRVRFRTAVLHTIREALKRRRVVRVAYRYRKTHNLRHYDLHPLGLLFGHRHYLVASRKPAGPPRHFVLGLVEQAEVLPHAAIPPAGFSLARHADRSFGLWQEEPIDVHWRFKPEVAEVAAEFLFHPGQTSQYTEDGSLHVRFRAGGIIEMDWHLYQWGNGVEQITPSARQWRKLLQLARQHTGDLVCP